MKKSHFAVYYRLTEQGYQEILGANGLIVLDGRNTLANQQAEIIKHARRLKNIVRIDAYSIHRWLQGTFTNSLQLTLITPIPEERA